MCIRDRTNHQFIMRYYSRGTKVKTNLNNLMICIDEQKEDNINRISLLQRKLRTSVTAV